MAASKANSRRKTLDAIALLKADHKKVQELIDQFDKARSSSVKLSTAREICMELKIHTALEEEIFYPAARKVVDDSDLLDEASIEHQSAKELIAQIDEGSPGEDMWDARVTVLGEYVKHHIKEEQNELFPEVRDSKLDLKALGEQLLIRKQELTRQFKESMNGVATRSKHSSETVSHRADG